MRDYLNYINDKYPIRRDDLEKKSFREFALQEVSSSNYEASIEIHKKQNNIIIGNVNSAEVIFTAHYDTPASSIISNVILPKNPVLRVICQLWLPLGIFALSSLIGLFVVVLVIKELLLRCLMWIALSFGLYFLSSCLLTRCFKNKHNKNDNTSGVATVLSLVKRCTSKKIAFVLFDNEERGLLGSKSFLKKNKKLPKDTLVINFDCVGAGNNVLFAAKKAARNHKLYSKLKEHNQSNNGFDALFYPAWRVTSNSDHKTFKCSIGVVTCKKKMGIYYTGKIHTNRDTEAYAENIDFLVGNMARFVDELS